VNPIGDHAIGDYLAELSPQLRRRRRRRIVTEVRAHLLDAAAADLRRGVDADRAARGAVERFGAPAHVAREFNAVRTRPGGLLRRVAAVMLASASMATLGTATVWAIEPGASHTHTHHHAQSHRSSAHR
jgi:hypothetical protein